jgi:MarR family transcriptional regulator, organic hydroperoxide resistance regulator
MTTPAAEAWELLRAVFTSQAKTRFAAIRAEFDLSKQQAAALHVLDPEVPKPTSELAEKMFCDASNVTGVIDRLEARGLVERRPGQGDRRVKLVALTADGVKLRDRLHERMAEPPEPIASLSNADQRALRDVLKRAVAAAG